MHALLTDGDPGRILRPSGAGSNMRELPSGTMVKLTVGVSLIALLRLPARAQACTTDALEPDDGCIAAATVIRGGESQNHDFCDDAADWLRFNACAGRSYTVATSGLGASADTVLELFDPSCATLLASDDEGGGGHSSRLIWSPSTDGVYHVRVRQADGTIGTRRSSRPSRVREAQNAANGRG